MAKRNNRLEVRLTKEEHNDLTRKARKAGLNTSTFVRMSIAGQEIRESPGADVPVLIQEVRRVGSEIDQLLKIAISRGLPEAAELKNALDSNYAVEKMIFEAYGV